MQESTHAADVHVIILNWNGLDDTIACIRSLEAQEGVTLNITVVDNGSKDDSVKILRLEFPAVHLIENGRNLGFAGGMNVGIQYALSVGADRVFLLNNDTIAARGMMRGLLQAMQGNVGITAPAIFYEAQPERIWSLGGKIHPLFLELLTPHGAASTLPAGPLERDFVTGCALLVHSRVFQQVGLLDEVFSPAYYEDLDFCLRARKKGIRIFVIPSAHLYHKISQASGGVTSPFIHYLMARNSALYFRKHMRFWQIPFIGVYRLLSAARTSIGLIGKGNWSALTAYWRGMVDGWLHRQKKSGNQYTAFYERR